MPAKGTKASAASSSAAGGKPPRRYPYSEAFFMEAIKEAIKDSLFSPITLGERHDVKLKPNFETACWAYQPPHKIYIGTELFEKRMVKLGLNDAQRAKYIANHYHHELGHALYTERDMRKIRAALKRIDAPFPLYNLFEDAYMEARYKKCAEYSFAWYELENADFSPRPESLLFSLIQAEGDVVMVTKAVTEWTAEPPVVDPSNPMVALGLLFAPATGDTRELLLEKFPRVLDYYRRITQVTQSMQLIPLVKAWIDEFGKQPEEMPKGGANGGMSDLELSADLTINPEKLKDFDEDTKPVSGTPETDVDKKNSKKGEANDDPSFVSKKGKVLHDVVTEVDTERARKLADKLQKFFAEKTRRVATMVPQTRISARHFALNRAPYRKTEVLGRGRKKVFFEVDCSGSMGGFHIMEGKLIVTALSMLAKRGYVEGHICLSAVTDTGPSWELFKLPMDQASIDRIQGFAGAEGLEFALKDNLKLLQAADFVFVYTDGQICDRPIVKSSFHRYGIFTWGLYAGERGNFMDEMMKYFDKAILRDTAEELIDAMLVQNK